MNLAKQDEMKRLKDLREKFYTHAHAASKEDEMPERAREALAQIMANKYASEFEQRGVKEVWQYGIAFCGKKCQIEAADAQGMR